MSPVGKGFLVVRTGNRRVGLDLSQVVAVTTLGAVHAVPVVEPAVRGVAAVHGKMVPVVHLGALLDGEVCPPTVTELGVLVNIGGRPLCFEVDEAEVLLRERALPVPKGTTLPWAVGVARDAEGLVPLLDLPALGARFLETESI